jgi:outer membrane receptor for ferrienterochelin and colicins
LPLHRITKEIIVRRFIIVFVVFLVFVNSTKGQGKSDANIVGHVTCEGNHIPFATVSITGTTIGVSTDETGHFMLINVPPGVYKVKAQSIGYKPSEKEVTVKARETIELKFDLESDLLGLEEVVISADRGEIKRVEAAAIVNTLSNRLFSSTQSVTLSEGLNFSPGLRIENNCQNCGFSQVRMNGMEGHYSQILINSRPIFSGLAGVYGLELIPSNMIERVEVVRGGGSALFGGSAIAGTINIILKDPVSDSYEAGINTGLTGFGVNGTGKKAYDYSVNLNTSLISDDGKTGVSLYGFSRERTDFDANNDGFSEIVPMNNMTLGTRIFHKTGVRSKLAVDLFNIKEERNGGNMQDYPLHERDLAEFVKHNIRTGAVTFEQYFRDYDMLSVFASAQGLSRDSYYGANKSLKNYGFSKDLTYNAGVQYKAVFAKSTVIGGIENTGGFLTDKKLGYPDLGNAVITGDSIISIPHASNLTVAKQSTESTGIFLQYEVKIDRMKISLGGRYDNFMVKDLAKGTSIKNGNVFSPRINIMYEVVKSLQARVSYSQGYRAPQIFDEDLHIETSGSRQVISVNDPDLKQETSHSFMASLDFNRLIGTTSTGLLLEGFYTRLTNPFLNEIGLPDATGLVKYTRRNAANGATVKGINIELKLSPLEKISFTSGFTVQASAYDEVHQFGQRSFFRTPSNYGFFAGDYDITDNLCLSLTGSYTGKMKVPYFGTLDTSGAGELHTSDTFFDMGLKISYTMNFSGSSLEWYTGLKNIFNSYQDDFDSGINRDPSYIYGPVSPRAVYLGVRIGNMLK